MDATQTLNEMKREYALIEVISQITNQGAISLDNVVSMESACPGVILNQMPTGGFTEEPSSTNYVISLEMAADKSKILKGVLALSVLALIWKFLSTYKSDSFQQGGGGSVMRGSSQSHINNVEVIKKGSEAINKVRDDIKQDGEKLSAAKLVPAIDKNETFVNAVKNLVEVYNQQYNADNGMKFEMTNSAYTTFASLSEKFNTSKSPVSFSNYLIPLFTSANPQQKIESLSAFIKELSGKIRPTTVWCVEVIKLIDKQNVSVTSALNEKLNKMPFDFKASLTSNFKLSSENPTDAIAKVNEYLTTMLGASADADSQGARKFLEQLTKDAIDGKINPLAAAITKLNDELANLLKVIDESYSQEHEFTKLLTNVANHADDASNAVESAHVTKQSNTSQEEINAYLNAMANSKAIITAWVGLLTIPTKIVRGLDVLERIDAATIRSLSLMYREFKKCYDLLIEFMKANNLTPTEVAKANAQAEKQTPAPATQPTPAATPTPASAPAAPAANTGGSVGQPIQ